MHDARSERKADRPSRHLRLGACHAAGIAWGFAVNPMIFRSLIAQGHRNLMLPGLAIGIAVSLVVLLIFLFLRKAMARPAKPT